MSIIRTKKKIWCVGQFVTDTEHGVVWEFQGVFISKDEAVKACYNSNYFVFSCVLGEPLPDQSIPMNDFEYPR